MDNLKHDGQTYKVILCLVFIVASLVITHSNGLKTHMTNS